MKIDHYDMMIGVIHEQYVRARNKHATVEYTEVDIWSYFGHKLAAHNLNISPKDNLIEVIGKLTRC